MKIETASDVDIRRLKAMSDQLRDLLSMWFSVGLLNLERVTWNSPCYLLQKVFIIVLRWVWFMHVLKVCMCVHVLYYSEKWKKKERLKDMALDKLMYWNEGRISAERKMNEENTKIRKCVLLSHFYNRHVC